MPNLTLDNTLPDPIDQFDVWFKEAQSAKIPLPEAFCLSTRDKFGNPDGRMILLKDFNKEGFVFYTNISSSKAEVILEKGVVCLTFYWEPLGRQVRIRGRAKQVSDKEADEYFKTRPRGSQLASWASRQSAVLLGRSLLEKRYTEYEKKFEGKEVPRPPFWSGFRVVPQKMEFWQERPNRLHDRILYERGGGKWEKKLLYP